MGRRRRRAACLYVVLFAFAVCAPAHAATISVAANEGEGTGGDQICSLREAISEANSNAGGGDCVQGSALVTDTIVVPAGNYQITTTNQGDDANAGGDFDITASVTISGAGSATTTIDALGHDRVIDILSGTVTISGVAMIDGQAVSATTGTPGSNGANGGGIRTMGQLTLSGVSVTGNAAGNGGNGTDGTSGTAGGQGGQGGGIWSGFDVPLTITGSTISQNRSGDGGIGGNGGTGNGAQGGIGGHGGGIFHGGGHLTITDTTVSGNNAGWGGPGGTTTSGTPGNGGFAGSGGGIAESAASNGGTPVLTRVTISGNTAGNGGGRGGTGASAGQAGDGGGMSVGTPALNIVDSRIADNTAGAAAQGPNTFGGNGGGANIGADLFMTGTTVSGNAAGDATGTSSGGGNGGGIYLGFGSVTVTGSTFTGSTTGKGGNSATTPTTGGVGGAIFDSATAFTLTNTTIEGNTTGAGGSYLGGGSGFGQQSGRAGGIWFSAPATLRGVTIANNTTGPGGSGSPSPDNDAEPSLRGGIAIGSSVTVAIGNTILASNTPLNCYLEVGGAAFADNGGNIAWPDKNFDCPGRIADPKLGALADNGGRTKTMALGAGSAAIDTGVNGQCTSTDQRGITRPQGTACDAGAFEKEQAPVTNTNTNTSTTPAGTTPTQTTPTTTPPTPAADKTPPVVRLLLTKQRLRKALKKGYAARFSSNEPGKATCTLTLKKRKVASGKLALTRAGTVRCIAKFTKKAKKALARKRKVKLRLRVKVIDAAGNATTKAASVTLKR